LLLLSVEQQTASKFWQAINLCGFKGFHSIQLLLDLSKSWILCTLKQNTARVKNIMERTAKIRIQERTRDQLTLWNWELLERPTIM
jgi:hypothetical protein